MKELYSYGEVLIRSKEILVNGEPFFRSEKDTIDVFLTEVYERLVKDYPKFYKMDKVSKLGFVATELLLADQPWIKEIQKEKVGVLVQTVHGSVDTDLLYLQNIKDPFDYFPSPSVFVYTLPNIVMGEICIRNGFKGENLCLPSESFDPELAKKVMSDWLSNNGMEMILLGWVDVEGNNYTAQFYAVGNKPEKTSRVFPQHV